MRKFLVLLLLSFGLILQSVPATAYSLNDNTLVQTKLTGGGSWGAWVDVVGNPSVFEVFGINFSMSPGYMTFEFYTNFDSDGTYNLGGGRYAYLADLGLDLDLDGTYEYGVVLKDHALWTGGTPPTGATLGVGLYSISSWDNSQHFFEGYPLNTTAYGGLANQSNPHPANVAVATGTLLSNSVNVSFNDIAGNNPNYMWSVTIATPGLTLLDDIGVFWGGMTCSNDAIEGTVPVPEPATMLLLGAGLVGLAGFGRKKLFGRRG